MRLTCQPVSSDAKRTFCPRAPGGRGGKAAARQHHPAARLDAVRAAVDGDLDAAHRPMLPEKAAGLSADHHRHAAILQGLEELRDQRIAEHEARAPRMADAVCQRSEEHTSELQSPMRISYAGFCLQ